MKTFIAIDGNAIIHRAFHALPEFRTQEGELVNAVYGFSSMLLNLIIKYQPDLIAVAFDSGKTFRHESNDDYKATRAKTADELKQQFQRTYEVLDAMQIPHLKAIGFEADDILGTIAHRFANDELRVMIATGDKDAFQLVNKNCQIIIPQGGFANAKIYDEEAVTENMGVAPKHIVDYKALCGDNSDNIKGVPGIGQKTAIKLINELGTVEKIYQSLDLIKGAVREKLIVGQDSALESKFLAKIVTDIELDLDLDQCRVHEMNFVMLEELFAALQFKSLMKKIEQIKVIYAEAISKDQGQQTLF